MVNKARCFSCTVLSTISMLMVTYPYTLKLTAPATLVINVNGTTDRRVLVGSTITLRRVHGISMIMLSGAKALARKRPAMDN